MAAPLKITVLGSGTSVGVPTLGCHCAVCTSTDPRDNRLRPSVLVSYQDRRVIVDTTPISAPRLSARASSAWTRCYTRTLTSITSWAWMTCGPSIFGRRGGSRFTLRRTPWRPFNACSNIWFGEEEQESWVLKLDPRLIDGSPLDLFGLPFLPVPILHGSRRFTVSASAPRPT